MESQYLGIIKKIIETGDDGDKTLSVFGEQMRCRLDRFPLFTTKKVFWRGVVEELLWMLRGSTNANDLRDKGVNIWNANATREFLDANGLHTHEVGDVGPMYGFQWRHFGATYTDMYADYTGQGIDQIQTIIDTIRTNPKSRRMILNAWNVKDLKMMALPPCHMAAQFYVSNGELSCMVYQRSCDMGLGIPFNVASYALLTCMIAHVTGLKPGELVHTLGDAHVYTDHIDALKVQMTRIPKQFPHLKIIGDVQTIDDFTFDTFELTNYNPYPVIKMIMI